MTPIELHEKTKTCVREWENILKQDDWEIHFADMNAEFRALDRILSAFEDQDPAADSVKSTTAYDPDIIDTQSTLTKKRPADILNNHFNVQMSFTSSEKEKLAVTKNLLDDYRQLLDPPHKRLRYT